MDTNPIPPPAIYPVVQRGSSVGRTFAAIVAAIILLVLVGVGYLFYKGYIHLGSLSGSSQTRFALLESTGVEWFSLSGSTVTSAPGPVGFDFTQPKILDATQQLKSKDVPVIAEISKAPSSENQLGLIRDGQFLSLLTLTKNDTHQKTGLIARNDGTLVFAESSSTASQNWTLYSLAIYSSPQAFLPLGPGFDPEFSSTSGAVLAIAPEGLVRVNPVENGRYTLIPRSGMTIDNAAISPNATLAVLPNSISKTLDLFSIDSVYATQVSYIGSVHDASSTAVAFISPTAFVVQDPGNHFTKYELQNKKIVSSALSFNTP